MNDTESSHAHAAGNGRRTALLIIVIAFVASATTLVLSLTASHHARKSDEAALQSDTADLQGFVGEWTKRVDATLATPKDRQPPLLKDLEARSEALSDWKPRTPCGQQSQEALRAAMDTRTRYLSRVQANEPVGEGHIDEHAALDQSLQRCSQQQGQDVDI